MEWSMCNQLFIQPFLWRKPDLSLEQEFSLQTLFSMDWNWSLSRTFNPADSRLDFLNYLSWMIKNNLGFSRFTDYTLKITTLANASKKHDQPNGLGKDQNRKKEAAEEVNMISKKQKRQLSDHQKCRHIKWSK